MSLVTKPPIKVGQVWRSKLKPTYQLEIVQKKDFRFKTRILTSKTGVYAGTHTVTPYVLYSRYELV